MGCGGGKIIVAKPVKENTIVMKKILYPAVMGFLLACGNEKTDDTKTESSPATPAVENVDGNIPDSTNSVNLNKPMPTDSSRLKDSTPR